MGYGHWDKAKKIRDFSDSLERRMAEMVDDFEKEKVKQLIKWIQDKADWLDPFISKEEKVLGKKYNIQNILEEMKPKKNFQNIISVLINEIGVKKCAW